MKFTAVMKLSTLPSIKKTAKRRLGQGHGSGRGKTGGRGQKGQTARGTMPVTFEGGQSQLVKRVPYLRGKGRNKPAASVAFPLNIKRLEVLSDGTEVTVQTLRKSGVIEEGVHMVKILGKTRVTKKLVVLVPCSESARKSIENAGGTVKGS